jgi:hypothetical protein
MMKLGKTSEEKALLASIMGPEKKHNEGELKMLHDIRNLSKDARTRKASQQIIAALSEYTMDAVQVRPKALRCFKNIEDESAYSPIFENHSVGERALLGTTRPIPLYIGVHRLPPLTGAYHRQAEISGKPGYESWAILSGNGTLVLREGKKMIVEAFSTGMCGIYYGGYDHTWLNLSKTTPLIIFNCAIPYYARLSKETCGILGKNYSVDFAEFSLAAKLPEYLSTDMRNEIKGVINAHNRSQKYSKKRGVRKT